MNQQIRRPIAATPTNTFLDSQQPVRHFCLQCLHACATSHGEANRWHWRHRRPEFGPRPAPEITNPRLLLGQSWLMRTAWVLDSSGAHSGHAYLSFPDPETFENTCESARTGDVPIGRCSPCLRGSPGSRMNVTILRNGSGNPWPVLPACPSKRVREKTGGLVG